MADDLDEQTTPPDERFSPPQSAIFERTVWFGPGGPRNVTTRTREAVADEKDSPLLG